MLAGCYQMDRMLQLTSPWNLVGNTNLFPFEIILIIDVFFLHNYISSYQ